MREKQGAWDFLLFPVSICLRILIYSASSLEEPQFQCYTHLVFLNTGAEHRYIMHFKIDIHVL